MRRVVIVPAVVMLVGLGFSAGHARAQPPDQEAIKREIEQLRRDLEEIRKTYSERLAALEAQMAAATAAPPPPAVQEAPPPAPAVPAASSKFFNPDMAVIGNFVGAAGRNPVDPSSPLEMREAELSFQAVVDPYARADFFIGVGPEGASLEEGFVTFPTLPGGLLLKAGKMRGAFGKLNGLHPHVLPWPDRPLVMRNLVGGEEGINDSGFSVARLVPNPWVFLEATGQVFRGDSSDVFHASEATDLNYVTRLRAYGDVSESTNVDLGTSFTIGHNDAGVVDGTDVGRFGTRLYGIDATVRYRPLRRSIYRSFIGRAELVWSRRQQFDGVQQAFGYYLSGDYQFARRWFTGFRYDRSGRAADASVLDTGVAAVLTFWPSEFSQVRGMYRRTRYARSQTANEFLFQVQFAIGAHGGHPF